MHRSFSEKLSLVSTYLSRTLIKMFTPNVAKDFTHLIEDLTENDKSFARKIDEAHQSLSETARLIERLETELKSKLDKVSKLKEDYAHYSQLADIEKNKSQALLNQLEKSLNKGTFTKNFWAFIINILAGSLIFTIGLYNAMGKPIA